MSDTFALLFLFATHILAATGGAILSRAFPEINIHSLRSTLTGPQRRQPELHIVQPNPTTCPTCGTTTTT